MTSCQEFQSLLQGYFNDTLNENERDQIETHFAECESCAKWVESVDGFENLISEMPRIQMPKVVKRNIFQRINKQENKAFFTKYSVLLHGKLKLAGAGIALAMLIFVLFSIPHEKEATPQTEQYSREQILRAENQLKWSLAYVGQVVKKTKKTTVEDVLLNQLPTTVRDCVEETVPFLKGGSK